jgi:hypothetical protein
MAVDEVFVAFRLSGTDTIDRVTAIATGGAQVHCELVVARGSDFWTYGSLYPDGVYASTVSRNSMFGVYDARGIALRVGATPREGGLNWEWVDVTALVGRTGSAATWASQRVGAGYRTAIFADLLLPVTLGGGGSNGPIKNQYICSEFVADALLATSGARAPQLRASVKQQTRWGGRCAGVDQGTEKLTPVGLRAALLKLDPTLPVLAHADMARHILARAALP